MPEFVPLFAHDRLFHNSGHFEPQGGPRIRSGVTAWGEAMACVCGCSAQFSWHDRPARPTDLART